MISCVVFDFDGTLVVSNQVKVQSFYEVVRDYDPNGRTVTDVLERCSNRDRYAITRELAREFTAKGLTPPQLGTEILSLQWAETYTTVCEAAIVNCPEVSGATEILSWLTSEDIPLYLNSGTPTEALNRLVTLRNLSHYFSGIYGSPARKVENLRHIQKLTHTNPDEICLVGDSEDDREAAAEFGCHFVGVILEDISRFRLAPILQVTNLLKLKAIIEKLPMTRPVLFPNKGAPSRTL
jgi:phosphoglycolate phosphatase